MFHDAIVIGRTPAAIEAAREAARNGLSTLVVPNGGGDRGGHRRAAPASDRKATTLAPGRWRCGAPAIAISAAASELERLCGLGVDVNPSATVAFVEEGRLRTSTGEFLEAPVIVIATGDRPRRPGRFAFDDQVVCDPESVLRLPSPPRNVLVIGAESDGCEVACSLAAEGSTVTIIDRRRRCLRYVDREVLEVLHAAMQDRGIELILDEWLKNMEICRAGKERYAVVSLRSGRSEVCETIVVAAGREASCEGLGLGDAGIETDELGFIRVDERGRTSREGVYAAGRVVGGLGECGEAFQGRSVIRGALGIEEPLEQPLPMVVQTNPEVALVGLTVEACERLGVPWVAGLAHVAVGREQIDCRSSGLLKLVANGESREVLGVHCVGAGARELIHLGSWMIRKSVTIEEIAGSIVAASSLGEAFAAAAMDCGSQIGRTPADPGPPEEAGRW